MLKSNNEIIIKDNGEVFFNELYILTETDEKGFVTYANDSFLKVSNLKKDEIIGQPHNLVRHNETPRTLFKNMWKSIQEKGFWIGVMKNQRKGGGFYWINATIIRSIDKTGRIKYVAIRTKPSRDDIRKAEELYLTLD
jgi:aerotaxis receptor